MRRSVLITFLSIFLAISCFVSLVFAEPQGKVAGPFDGPMAAVKKAEPPTPGRLSQTVKLNPQQRGLLSASGELAIYGPHISLSREQIKEMKASRLQRGSSGSDTMKALAAKRKKMVNDRAFWLEDLYTTLTTQSEVSSAVCGNHIVAGWNDFETWAFGGFDSVSNWAVSHNGGKTFTDSLTGLPTSAAPITATGGDPAIDVDSSCTFYYASLCTYNDGVDNYSSICVYRSLDNGDTFNLWWYLIIGDVNDFLDKEMLVVDRNNGKVYVTYTYFNDASPFFSIVLWNVTDAFLTTVESNDIGLQGSIPGVDYNGNLYVAYEEWDGVGNPYIKIEKSTNFGATFPTKVDVLGGSFISVADFDASGFCGRDALKGNIRSNEFPSLAVNTRPSVPGAEKLYIAYNAWNPATFANDIFITRSTDGGINWSTPIRANPRKAGVDFSDKFFPWITVNGKGKVGLIYYDRKKMPGVTGIATNNWWITTFVRRFKPNLTPIDLKKLSPTFPVVVNNDYTAACYMAEYNSISANRQSADDNFYVFWGDNRYGDPDIQFSKVVPLP